MPQQALRSQNYDLHKRCHATLPVSEPRHAMHSFEDADSGTQVEYQPGVTGIIANPVSPEAMSATLRYTAYGRDAHISTGRMPWHGELSGGGTVPPMFAENEWTIQEFGPVKQTNSEFTPNISPPSPTEPVSESSYALYLPALCSQPSTIGRGFEYVLPMIPCRSPDASSMPNLHFCPEIHLHSPNSFKHDLGKLDPGITNHANDVMLKGFPTHKPGMDAPRDRASLDVGLSRHNDNAISFVCNKSSNTFVFYHPQSSDYLPTSSPFVPVCASGAFLNIANAHRLSTKTALHPNQLTTKRTTIHRLPQYQRITL